MKRIKSFVLSLAMLTVISCEAMFDLNLYSTIDTPPKLDSSKLSSASTSDLESQLSEKFYTQLKNDPAALVAVENNLKTTMQSGTAAQKALAAQVFVQVMANATEASPVVSNLITTVLPLASDPTKFEKLATDPAQLQATISDLFAGQSAAQISSTLQSFVEISKALAVLQTASTSAGGTTDSAMFYGDTIKGDMAQIGVTATLAAAIVSSVSVDPAITDPALILEAQTAVITSLITATDPTVISDLVSTKIDDTKLNTQFTDIGNVINNKGTTPTGDYAYLSTLKEALPISGI